MSGVNIVFKGNKYRVENTRIIKTNDGAIATATIRGRVVSVTYTGITASELSETEGKPWLNQARQDLVAKYIATKGLGKGYRLSKEEIASIREMHDSGVSVREIVDKTGISQVTVYKYIKRKDEILRVNSEFLDILRDHGLNVNGNTVTVAGRQVNIVGMGQIEALRKLIDVRNKAISTEREEVAKLLSQLTA